MNCIFIPEFLDSSFNNECSINDIFNTELFKSYLGGTPFAFKTVHLQGFGEEFGDLFKLMFCEYAKAKTAYNQILKQLLIILLIKIIREYISKLKKLLLLHQSHFQILLISIF